MLKAIIIGNVGNSRFIQSGNTKLLTVTVASNEKRGDKKYTNWVTLKFWGKRAEKLKNLISKGRKIYAEGRPESEAYQTKEGELKSLQTIHVEGKFLFLNQQKQEIANPAEQ